MRNILFFGDSLTAGYGLGNADNEAFPALIQQRINLAGLDYKAINAGLSGDTSGGGLARLDYWLHQPVDIFVLELGVNDIIRRIPPQTTLKNLQAIINKVKAKYPAVKVAIMGMQIPAFIPGPFAVEFRKIYQTLADTNHCVFVPFFLEGVAGKAHLNLRDGLHPSAQGYQVIAEKVWPVLRGMLTP